jgi:phosphatidate cytidylyltransferase
LLILIWANDSYAYLAGRTWGRNPLWASVSPKKTWEGTIGGAAGTFLTGILWAQFVPGSGMAEMMTAAAVVSVFRPLGDLFESSIKRAAGVKDSGHWLPGHGGLLDRLDSLLWAAPAYWLATTLFSF